MKDINIIDILGLIIATTALVISIVSIIIAKNIAYTDRKVNTYIDAIVYLDKLTFRSKSSDIIGNELIKEQVLVAVDICSRLKILDKEKARTFWDIVTDIYGEEHKFDSDKYQKLHDDITKEITNQFSWRRFIENK